MSDKEYSPTANPKKQDSSPISKEKRTNVTFNSNYNMRYQFRRVAKEIFNKDKKK